MLLIMLVPIVVAFFASMWIAWWLAADFLATDRSPRIRYVAPVDERRGMPVLTGQNIRLVR